MLIEIDPKIIEEKLRAEFGPSYLEDTIPSEKISHINIKEGADSVFPQDKFDVYVRSGDRCFLKSWGNRGKCLKKSRGNRGKTKIVG